MEHNWANADLKFNQQLMEEWEANCLTQDRMEVDHLLANKCENKLRWQAIISNKDKQNQIIRA